MCIMLSSDVLTRVGPNTIAKFLGSIYGHNSFIFIKNKPVESSVLQDHITLTSYLLLLIDNIVKGHRTFSLVYCHASLIRHRNYNDRSGNYIH